MKSILDGSCVLVVLLGVGCLGDPVAAEKSTAPSVASRTRKPKVVVFLTDDQGWGVLRLLPE